MIHALLTPASAPEIPHIIGHAPAPALTLALLRAPAFLPAAMTDFLFGTPWMYWLGLAALAAAALYVGRARANPQALRAAYGLAGLLVVWIPLALLLDTPGERLHSAHKAILKESETKDIRAIVAWMAPDFRCDALGVSGASDAGRRIDELLTHYGIRSNLITRYRYEMAYPTASTTVTVVTQTEVVGPVQTTWRLDWEDTPGADWRIHEAQFLKLGSEPAPAGEIPRSGPR